MDFGSLITAVEKMNGLQLLGVITLIAILTWGGKYLWNKRKKKKKRNLHDQCPFFADHLLLVEKAIHIFELRELTLIRQQMVLVDRSVDSIKSSMIASLSDMSPKVLRYLDILFDKIIVTIKEQLKLWIRTNHILEMSPIEFRIYSNGTADKLLSQIHLMINQYWDDTDWSVSRVDIISSLDDQGIIEILLQLLLDIQEEARKIEEAILRL